MRSHLLAVLAELYDRGLVTNDDFWFVKNTGRIDKTTRGMESLLEGAVKSSESPGNPIAVGCEPMKPEVNDVDPSNFIGLYSFAGSVAVNSVDQEEVDAG
jgi:hypothetical protein